MESKFVECTRLENYQLDRAEVIHRTKLKSDFVPYGPTSTTGVKTTAPFKIIVPREDVCADLRDSYLEIETQVIKNDETSYADDDAIQPNNLSRISLFREMTLSSFDSKNLERVESVYLASLMYKLLSDNGEDMMTLYKKTSGAIDDTKRNRQLNDTPEKSTIFVRVYSKVVFGLIIHLDKINYGLG